MKDKYYIPTIDEFHVGFEYDRNEEQPKNYWDTPLQYEKKWITHKWDEHQTRLGKLRYMIQNKDIRVKYLDRDDIKSLGITTVEIHIKSRTEHKDITYYDLYNGSQCIGEFYYNNKPNNIKLFGLWFNIKNKSELSKLMKQLNIIK